MLAHGNFEDADDPAWQLYGDVWWGPGRESDRAAHWGGRDSAVGEMIQTIEIPEGAQSAALSFWSLVESPVEQQGDALEVIVQQGEAWSDHLLALPAVDPRGVWRLYELDLSPYAGQVMALTFLAHTDDEGPSTFLVDDVSLVVCHAPAGRPALFLPLALR